MAKILCSKCDKVYDAIELECPVHGKGSHVRYLEGSDNVLKDKAESVIKERRQLGLEGLVGGLDSIIINVEPENYTEAGREFLKYTNHDLAESFANESFETAVFCLKGSADIVVRCRKGEHNPFLSYNLAPISRKMPNTRLETFVFRTKDIKRYVNIQKKRGIEFLTDEIIKNDYYLFIQTKPSRYTGTSVGLIQWLGDERKYCNKNDTVKDYPVKKPDRNYLANIKYIDHAATRLRAQDRDAAIIEFMQLTNYKFDFAIYVKLFNSITTVARLSPDDFAMVFTSGISPYKNDLESGPTEKFIHNFNARTHHLAFASENIEQTFEHLKKDDLKFLIELVGSPQEGLKQTFTEGSKATFLVNEYIHRYGDFDGFFTKNNVTLLTESTGKQEG